MPFSGSTSEHPDLDQLLGEVLGALLADPGLDREGLKAHLHATPAAETLQRFLLDETLNSQKFLRPGAELNEVERGWSDALRLHLLATDAKQEMAHSASQTFSDGEEVWKAAVLASEALRNKSAFDGRSDEDGQAKKGDLDERLEKMRTSVSRKRDRSPGR